MSVNSMASTTRISSVIIVLIAFVALIGGMGAGLARLGWRMDTMSSSWLLIHGPLMISGFLGTLICTERAVAIASRYPLSILVPIINAAGTVTLLLMPHAIAAKALLTAGSIGLLVLFSVMLRLHPSRDMIVMAFGAFCWVLGNGLWLRGYPVPEIVHLWVAFLVLTIVGERLELSRVRRLTQRAEQLFIIAVSIYMSGVFFTIFNLDWGIRVLGIGAVLIAAWLLQYDIARRTIFQNGLPRYIAACLLTGYIWLGFAGLMAMWKGAVYGGFDYSLILHAFLLGFVFSMIFGHMPIILPALTGLKLEYSPLFYGHLMLLHITLVIRSTGNLIQSVSIGQWGGLFNVLTVLLFMGVTMFTLLRSNMPHRASTVEVE
jgi:hypothetical protein